MEISPAQRRHVGALWNRVTRQLPSPLLSTHDALAALGALNLPLAIAQGLVKHRAMREAEEQWDGKLTKLTSFLYGEEDGLKTLTNRLIGQRMEPFFSSFALTRSSLHGAWWTPLTASLLHKDFTHLIKNMAAFLGVAPICAQVPGMSALHVFGLALGTSLVTGGVTLLRYSCIAPTAQYWPSTCGFSAIVCAFTSIATLGFTGPDARLYGSYHINVNSLWMTMLGQIAYDFYDLLDGSTELGPAWLPGSKSRSDPVSHLLGAGFGALYYYAFLRHHRYRGNGYRLGRR